MEFDSLSPEESRLESLNIKEIEAEFYTPSFAIKDMRAILRSKNKHYQLLSLYLYIEHVSEAFLDDVLPNRSALGTSRWGLRQKIDLLYGSHISQVRR